MFPARPDALHLAARSTWENNTLDDVMPDIVFRSYRDSDLQTCLEMFDANCPDFFAQNERQEYQSFLESIHDGYEICEVDGRSCGAFGVFDDESNQMRIRWILLDLGMHGLGIGSKIMTRIVEVARDRNVRIIRIAASHKSSSFFARFGASTVQTTKNGWGIGMDRVDMELPIKATREPTSSDG